MKTNRISTRRPAAPITPAQVTTIKMGKNALGIPDDIYYDTLQVRYGGTSCKDLNQEQASDLIDDYVSRGFVLIQPAAKARKRQKQSYPPRPKRNDKKVIALATRDEIDKINALADLTIWQVEGGLARFLEKRMGIKDGKVRTSADAYKAIEGLKKLFENFMKRQHGPAWWTMKFDNPAIMTYIREHKPAKYR